jgi:hypothetical protein
MILLIALAASLLAGGWLCYKNAGLKGALNALANEAGKLEASPVVAGLEASVKAEVLKIVAAVKAEMAKLGL